MELTQHVALATLYSRTNTAFGIESQGLAASCELRPLTRAERRPALPVVNRVALAEPGRLPSVAG